MRAFGSKSLALAATSLGLSACVTTDGDKRHLVPIPASLISEMSAKGMSPADPIMVRIFKKESELEIWKRDRSGQYALLKTYPMCRWSGTLGPKKREGDRQSPEGFYTVTPGLMNPRSQFHLSFNLGYPNALEQSQGFTGSALMVHGACTSAGCFAMTDNGVSEIYAMARETFAAGNASFQVQSLPFRMSADNLVKHRNDANIAFWKNLKEGVDHFDATKQPPRLAACGRRYVFNAKEGGPSMTPGYACPSIDVDPVVVPLIAELKARDDARTATLMAAGIPPMTLSYADGGMHTSFRGILRSAGAATLQSMTSGRVEVSRPEAALADPFDGKVDVVQDSAAVVSK
jgi:murein L,D-transpeptidase YafK